MKKKFKSKVDLLILLPLLLILTVAEFYMIIYDFLPGVIAIGLVAAFVIYMCLDTLYVVTNDHKLRIKSGFLYDQEIYIKAIKKVREVKGRRASPALSPDRLEISYNRYGKVMVSPHNKTAFLKELKDVNPRIRIEEKD